MRVRVRTNQSAVARLSGERAAVAHVGVQGAPGVSITNIASMTDVNMDGLEDGCVLVWSAAESKWVATRILNKQIIDMGSESY